MRQRSATLACVLAVGIKGPPLAAQDESGLSSLAVVKEARSRRVSSTSPDGTSNRDNVWVAPGATHALADIDGPGVIRHIWLTFSEAAPNWLAKDGAASPAEIVLRAYWDGAPEPAVEAPIGDFFAAGFGKRAEVRSTPIQVEGGDSYNCFWAMPFFKKARLTVSNESEKPLAALYYQIDYTEEQLSPEAAYFCAQYRQEFPETLGKDYLVLDAQGHGHYVGTVLSVRTRSPEWFGEGDDKISIDGEPRPSIWGTGTEDYFLNAWGLQKGCFPYFGVTLLAGDWGEVGQRLTAYRWHVADPIRFTRSLRVELEHFGWMSADETVSGAVEGFVEREDDVATVAFWYQRGQPKRFSSLPRATDRAFPSLDLVFEGKDLLPGAHASRGTVSLQKGYEWTGEGQLFFDAQSDGASVEVEFEVKAKERRRLVLPITHSYDFGIYRISLDGAAASGSIDFYSPSVVVKEHGLGDRELEPGKHVIRLECTGRNPLSSGYKLGVDSIRLRKRFPAKRSPPAPPGLPK